MELEFLFWIVMMVLAGILMARLLAGLRRYHEKRDEGLGESFERNHTEPELDFHSRQNWQAPRNGRQNRAA